GSIGKLLADRVGAIAATCVESGLQGTGELGPKHGEALAYGVGGLAVGGGVEHLSSLCDVPAFQPAFLDDAARNNQLVVKTVAVAGGRRESSVGEHGGGSKGGSRHGTHCDAMDLLAVSWGPDFGAEQAETALHEAMVEVGEYNVVPTGGGFGVER